MRYISPPAFFSSSKPLFSSVLCRPSTVAPHNRTAAFICARPASLFTPILRLFAVASKHRPPTVVMERVNTTARLAELRRLMTERNIDVYVVPSEDSHSSEYIAPCDARRAFISGFTGSAGTAVVTAENAALATDGRYFNQASKQLDMNWKLLKLGNTDVPTWQEYTVDQSVGGKIVGVDPALLSSSQAQSLLEKIKEKGGKDLVAVTENLVDLVWGGDRPARPSNAIVLQDEKYAGKSASSKLGDLRLELEKKGLSGFVVSALDEIAWLFNLRGSDIPYNPVFFSYALITGTSATLYVDSSKLSPECESYLTSNEVDIKPYDSIFDDAKTLAETTAGAKALAKAVVSASGDTSGKDKVKKQAISKKTSWALKLALGGDDVEEIRSPVGDAKAIKNATELEGMRQCHIRDGAALIEFFAWLENRLTKDKVATTEVDAASKLEAIRTKLKDFVGLSFPTISATGPNAAIIHYNPEEGSNAIISPNRIYLCDTGAQFLDGTTDTTRTLHFGIPHPDEVLTYTLVLKGNIALDMAVFPRSTNGFALDVLARQFLWQSGLEYRHGTGHGVGSYLNVHEGPIGIGTRRAYTEVSLAAGHVTSIEPGYYEDGKFGIRIENIAMVRDVGKKSYLADKTSLGFEHVTMVPYCRRLIKETLLTPVEKKWLNDYSSLIREKTRGFFLNDPVTLAWLDRETEPFE